MIGMLDDGASGKWNVKRCDGITLVQDLHEAMYPSVPKTRCSTWTWIMWLLKHGLYYQQNNHPLLNKKIYESIFR